VLDKYSEKISEDIEYIKTNYKITLSMLKDHTVNNDIMSDIKIVLNYIGTNDIFCINNANTIAEIGDIANIFSPFRTSMEAFIHEDTPKTFNNFINNAISVFRYMIEHEPVLQSKNHEITIPNEIVSRLEKVEELLEEPKKVLDSLEEINKLSSDNFKIAKELVSEAKTNTEAILSSKQLADKQLEEITKIRDNQISVELSEQFEKKTTILNYQRGVFMVLFIFVLGLLYIFNLNFSNLLITLGIKHLTFLETFGLRIVFGMPIIFGIFVLYNEYLKSSKLYEEYEFKRISAITLFNNHSRLKTELKITSEELSESLKVSMDRIFENPVHSIFGDKSADKNIGLEQLEKIMSIAEKLKPKS
jgi:hypothetical protein